jgi:hypothetical protein
MDGQSLKQSSMVMAGFNRYSYGIDSGKSGMRWSWSSFRVACSTVIVITPLQQALAFVSVASRGEGYDSYGDRSIIDQKENTP